MHRFPGFRSKRFDHFETKEARNDQGRVRLVAIQSVLVSGHNNQVDVAKRREGDWRTKQNYLEVT